MSTKVRKTLTEEPLVERMPESPEARQMQLVSLAEQCAEEQLRNRTASSAVIVHYLKLATAKEQVECERLKCEAELARAKIAAISAAADASEKYERAIAAMKAYSGKGDEDDVLLR